MALTHIFGERPIPKILDFFTVNQFWDYSLRDIKKETGVGYRTLQMIIPSLVREGVLRHTRTEGKAKLYQINMVSAVVRELRKISRESDFEYPERMMQEDKASIPHPVPA
ncbi:MAG: hypothetical protein U9Q22_07465 [Candidatus Altiarchaeota archaeon]|nr:hypothetical protein [Candidatus Altiarchaeota archaeon]